MPKVNEAIEVIYVPGNFQSGKTDCKVEIFDENGIEIPSSPFDMTEKDDGAATPELLGIYGYSFTPDAEGIWIAKAYRLIGSNKRFTKTRKYRITSKDIDDVATSSEVSNVETKVDAVDSELDNMKGAGFDSGTDSLEQISDSINEISEGGDIL